MSFQLDLEVKLLHDVHDLWNRHRFLFYSLFEFTTFNSLTNPTLPLPPIKCIVILSCMVFFLVTWNICFWIRELVKYKFFNSFWKYDFPRFDKCDQWPQMTLALAIFFSNIVCFLDGWRFKHANRRAMTKVEKGRDSGKQWA